MTTRKTPACFSKGCRRGAGWTCRVCGRLACGNHSGFKNVHTKEATCSSCYGKGTNTKEST